MELGVQGVIVVVLALAVVWAAFITGLLYLQVQSLEKEIDSYQD